MGRLIKNSIQCSLSGTPTFSNTSSLSFRFRFRGLRFTRTHFATSALTCCASPHSARAWRSLCSGSPAVGEGESRAPEPALRAVAPPPQRTAAGAGGPQHLRHRACLIFKS